MFQVYLLIACAFASGTSTLVKRRVYHDVSYGSKTSDYHTNFVDVGSHGGFSEKELYSAGSGLKTIAQGSADQANNAVISQHTAARQAAFTAKNSLAQAASNAAATAQAALVGKHILVQKLEKDLSDANQDLQAELHQLELAQNAAASAQAAAQQAQQQQTTVTAALNAIQTTTAQASQAAQQSTAELGSQQAMVGRARQRLSSIAQQLHAAQSELKTTQAAAQQAEGAALIAQSNAAQASKSASSSSLHNFGGSQKFGFSSLGLSAYHH